MLQTIFSKVRGLFAADASKPAKSKATKVAQKTAKKAAKTRPGSSNTHQTFRIQRNNHGISRNQIDKAALDVLYQLKRAGYEAYLVGGGVRDLLLGLEPK